MRKLISTCTNLHYCLICILFYKYLPFISFSLFPFLLTQQYTRQYLLVKGYHLHFVSTKPTEKVARANPDIHTSANLYITNAIKYARRPNHFVGFINNDVHWSPEAHVFFHYRFQEVIIATLLCNGVSKHALPPQVWIIIFSFLQRKSFKSKKKR
jgi:hypothetical protein